MSVSYWQTQNTTQPKKVTDVCIVGAGLTGFSTAYWLNQEDPSLKITIVDKALVGSGATGRNAGFVTCGSVEHFNRMVSKHGESQALEIWNFAADNLELLKQKIFPYNQPKSCLQRGAFSLAAQPNEFDELKNVAQLMQKNNIPVEVLNQQDVESRLGAVDFVGGIKYKNDAEVDPLDLLKSLALQVQAEVYENCEVMAIEEANGGARLLRTSQCDIEATLVILCLNGYSASVVPDYFHDKIYPTRGQIMMLEPVKPFMEGPCYANFYLDYFRQLQDGSLLIGGFRQLEADTEKGYSEHTTLTIQKALHDFVIKHLPQFKQARVTHRWAGVMGFSCDGEPMIGSLPSDNQVFFCGGFTGHGTGMAFHGARKTVDLIFGRPIPDWLSAKRF